MDRDEKSCLNVTWELVLKSKTERRYVMNLLNTVIPIGFVVIIALIWKISDRLNTVNQNLEHIQDILKSRR